MASSSASVNAHDAQVISCLAEETRAAFAAAIGPLARETGVALLDFPSHQNVGDTMIWLGELAHLRALGIPVRYVADIWRFDATILADKAPGAPILLHGGGNLGDLWPWYQEFREHIMRTYRDRAVVQLPQTVRFTEPKAAERFARLADSHPDYTLLVRDTSSLRTATHLGVRVAKCPDAAFGMGPQRRAAHTSGTVLLLRGDREQGKDRDALLRDVHGDRVDWRLTGLAALAFRAVRGPGKLHRRLGPDARRTLHPLVTLGYRAQAALNMRDGLQTVGRAEMLITDRLHAHVLACLLGVPNRIVDNSYGKVRSAFDDYTHAFSTASLLDE